jgi:hypothetical protein
MNTQLQWQHYVILIMTAIVAAAQAIAPNLTGNLLVSDHIISAALVSILGTLGVTSPSALVSQNPAPTDLASIVTSLQAIATQLQTQAATPPALPQAKS